ncbi:MAG TPA: recombinational DNA repair protein (RecE pathway) [Desulfosporosinus sp.]|nr:recombinational DNA repair protein (RecE pathway) [Desulfosporosinus sp.]
MSKDLTVKNDHELTMSERFMNKVLAEFRGGVGEVVLTNFQKRLAQNYFMVADMALRSAEDKRKKKAEKYRDKVPVVWSNVDMEKLAQSVVSAARIGWDPTQDNHVSLIPFKDNATQKYSMTFMPGYRGIELKAKKYGLDVPDVAVELVYSNDRFKSFKKDRNNKVETYEFEIVNDFDRGTIIGGFYYHSFPDKPEMNKLVVLTLKDIEKRKPKHASAEFWGGEKDVWENGQKVGKETVEGWYDKMCYKTIYRAAYKDITIDSQKIDDDYMKLKQIENEFAESDVERTIAENANQNVIDITPPENESPDCLPEPEQVHHEDPPIRPVQENTQAPAGPDF